MRLLLKANILLAISALFLTGTSQAIQKIESEYTWQILEDKLSGYSIHDVLFPPLRKEFRTPENRIFGLQKETIWLRAFYRNTESQNIERVFEYQASRPGLVEIYVFHDGHLIKHVETGSGFPYSTRELSTGSFAFVLNLHAKKAYEIYLRISHDGFIPLGFSMTSVDQFWLRQKMSGLILGCFFGLMVAFAFFNLLMFFLTRASSFLFLSVMIFLCQLVVCQKYGYLDQFVFPEMPGASHFFSCLFLGLFNCSTIIFLYNFLKERINQGLVYLFFGLIILSVLGTIFAVFDYNVQVQRLTVLTHVIAFPLVIYGGIKSWLRGYPASHVFLLGWSSGIIGVLVELLFAKDILINGYWGNYFMIVGFMLGTILLTLGKIEFSFFQVQELERLHQAAMDLEIQARKRTEKKCRILESKIWDYENIID